MSFSSPEAAHAPGCHSWRGGGEAPSPARPNLSESPNHEENKGKKNEQWLLFPVPLRATGEGRGRSCAGRRGLSCARSWGDVGWIKGPPSPLPAPQGAPAAICALWHVEHPKNRSKWWGAAIPVWLKEE